MLPTSEKNGRPAGWSLQIVRGREIGKALALDGPAIVLGNAIDGAPGIDLRDQEGASPRRMAGRQAMIEATKDGLSIRDLDSPGGTFVNRRRLLAGQSLAIGPGDEIQIGGVLLRVIHESAGSSVGPTSTAPPPIPQAPGRLPEPFAIGGAVVGRTWDDFLTAAANRWADLRDEMTSGRLETYLRRIGFQQSPTEIQLSLASRTNHKAPVQFFSGSGREACRPTHRRRRLFLWSNRLLSSGAGHASGRPDLLLSAPDRLLP